MVARIVAAAWALAIVVAIVIAAVSPATGAVIVGGTPRCPMLFLTGIECPFCGMTRASVALARGDVHAALAYHPLAPLVLVGVLFLLAIVALGRTNSLIRGHRPLLLLGVIGVVWVLRLVL